MKIHSGINNQCVDRAFSTARALLGLDANKLKLPKERTVSSVIRYIGRNFPGMDVFVWTHSSNLPREIDWNVCYCGNQLIYNFNDGEYVFMYVYGSLELNQSHIVLGLPAFGYQDSVFATFAIRMEHNNVN